MRKRVIRGLIAGASGVLVLALGTAHAAVSVDIATPDDSVLYSLPALPSLEGGPAVDYPSTLARKINGTAGFDSLNGSVLFAFSDSEDNVVFSGDAPLTCDSTGSACTWEFTVPFAFAPGTYELVVTASEPNLNDPDNPNEASDAITVTIL